jgi:lactoylglutathione lyase
MHLAKPHFDVGLFTNKREEQLAFWQDTVGLEFDHLGKLGGGMHQLRHHMNGSIMKVNHARDPLPEAAPSGYRELFIARDGLEQTRHLADPDGNSVTLVPPGSDGIVGIGLSLAVSDMEAARRFWIEVMEFDDAGNNTVRCGDSLLFLHHDENARPVDDNWRSFGLRYITVQIYDCQAEHAGILARGGREGRAPIVLGDTVRYSFVRDPDGNWIEISQRASLTGNL